MKRAPSTMTIKEQVQRLAAVQKALKAENRSLKAENRSLKKTLWIHEVFSDISEDEVAFANRREKDSVRASKAGFGKAERKYLPRIILILADWYEWKMLPAYSRSKRDFLQSLDRKHCSLHVDRGLTQPTIRDYIRDFEKYLLKGVKPKKRGKIELWFISILPLLDGLIAKIKSRENSLPA